MLITNFLLILKNNIYLFLMNIKYSSYEKYTKYKNKYIKLLGGSSISNHSDLLLVLNAISKIIKILNLEFPILANNIDFDINYIKNKFKNNNEYQYYDFKSNLETNIKNIKNANDQFKISEYLTNISTLLDKFIENLDKEDKFIENLDKEEKFDIVD